MKVRKFFAPSSREALRLVREALGADAVVLSNRVVDGGVELVALTEETLTDMVDEPQQPAAAFAAPTPTGFGQQAHMQPRVGQSHAPQTSHHTLHQDVQAHLHPEYGDDRGLERSVGHDAGRRDARGPLDRPNAARPVGTPTRDDGSRSANSSSALGTPTRMLRQLPPRDRTIALPGVLAAGNIGDDGASALAYVHRAAQTAQQQRRVAAQAEQDAEAGRAAHAPASASMSAYRQSGFYAVEAGTDDANDGFDDADATGPEADVVWRPSVAAVQSIEAAQSGFTPAPVTAPASATTPAPATTPASATTPAPATASVSAAAPAPATASAPAPASLLSRVFSRPSFRERAGVAESGVTGLLRPEKRDDESSVLGLLRAERQADSSPAPLTASVATARGLGSVSSNIVVRPAAMPEEQLPARHAPTPAVLPQEPDVMIASQQSYASADGAHNGFGDEAMGRPAPFVADNRDDGPADNAFASTQPTPVADTLATSEPPLLTATANAPATATATDAGQTPSVAESAVPAQTAPAIATGSAQSAPSFGTASYSAQTRMKGDMSMQPVEMSMPFLGLASAVASASASASASVPAERAASSARTAADTLDAASANPAVEADVDSTTATTFDSSAVPSIDLSAAPMTAPVETAVAAAAVSAVTAAAAAAAVGGADAGNPRQVAGKVLSEMRTLCGTLGEQLEAIDSHERERRDPTRIALTRMLLACGFSAQLVRLLLGKLPPVSNAEEGLAWIKATFERNLPVLENEDALMGQGGVFALMGPTGVGKTTTTAKLAARAVMRHGADRVALLTTDSYRIGAHEQLRIYGRILGVAVHAVKDAADLSLVLSELRNKHMVLIDTIGMSQRDRAVSEQVAMLCGTHLPVKRLLLLNATSHGDTLNEVVRAYGAQGQNGQSGLSGCIITKVDESNGIGAALDTVMRHRLPVHYVSNGQKVPEDLRVARRGFLIDKAFSERHRESPFEVDEADIALMFGAEAQGSATSLAGVSGEVQYG